MSDEIKLLTAMYKRYLIEDYGIEEFVLPAVIPPTVNFKRCRSTVILDSTTIGPLNSPALKAESNLL